MNPTIFYLIIILAITTIITYLIKFYEGIWRIHKSIDKQSELIDSQNDLIHEQNQLIKKYIDLQKNNNAHNS